MSNVFNFSPLSNFIPLIASKDFNIVKNHKNKFFNDSLKPLTFCYFFKPMSNFYIMWNDEMIAILLSSKKDIKSTKIIEKFDKL